MYKLITCLNREISAKMRSGFYLVSVVLFSSISLFITARSDNLIHLIAFLH